MADDPNREDEFELEVLDDVEWLVDEDGTEYFLDGGVRYELGDDGYAYAVETDDGPPGAGTRQDRGGTADGHADAGQRRVESSRPSQPTAASEVWGELTGPGRTDAMAAWPGREAATDEVASGRPRPLVSSGPLSGPRLPGSVASAASRVSAVGPAATAEELTEEQAPVDDAPSPFSRQASAAPAGDSGDPSGVADPTDRVEPVDRSDPVDPDDTTQLPPLTGSPLAADDRRARDGSGSDEAHSENGRGELLRLEGVRSGYGSLPVLHGVEMAIRTGETAVLLGLNGAGKTTTAMSICGALRTWDGTVTFDGRDITTWSTRRAVAAGVVMVPEGRRVFPDLSVAKNLQMGAWSQRRDREWVRDQQERVFGYFPRLRERAGQLAGTLSGGEQQMLAIARGLMARPKLLIIDEASMGLAPVIVADVFDIVRQINEDGTTVLMIEQNVAALDVADVAYVMEQGRMVRELRGDALRDRTQVSEVLMG